MVVTVGVAGMVGKRRRRGRFHHSGDGAEARILQLPTQRVVREGKHSGAARRRFTTPDVRMRTGGAHRGAARREHADGAVARSPSFLPAFTVRPPRQVIRLAGLHGCGSLGRRDADCVAFAVVAGWRGFSGGQSQSRHLPRAHSPQNSSSFRRSSCRARWRATLAWLGVRPSSAAAVATEAPCHST